MLWNKLWIIGNNSKWYYIRFYPNPGFMIRFFGRRYKWSKHWGFKKEKI